MTKTETLLLAVTKATLEYFEAECGDATDKELQELMPREFKIRAMLRAAVKAAQ